MRTGGGPGIPARRAGGLDFGPFAKDVRWIEETPPERFPAELEERLGKRRRNLPDLLKAAALAAARSVRHEGRTPHGLLAIPAARALVAAQTLPGRVAGILAPALRLVHAEIHDPQLGPFRLPDRTEPAAGTREEIVYDFLEAIHGGDPEGADLRFSWLIQDFDKEQATDLLLSAGLEGVTEEVHKVVSVVETIALLQWSGWEWAPVLLRPVVRQQAWGRHRPAEYDRCCQVVADRQLLRLTRRRAPGVESLGEKDAPGLLERALEWAEADPDTRLNRTGAWLAEGIPLEDVGEILGLGSTLLFLQEALRKRGAEWTPAQAAHRMHLVTGVQALRRLIRIGTPGQRILGLLLAGWIPGVRDLKLEPRSPDCGWWLPPATKIAEPPASGDEAAEAPAPIEEWEDAVGGGRLNALLPRLAERMESGRSVAPFEATLARLAPGRDQFAGLSMKLERTLADAYTTTRSPHRWFHLWGSAVALCLWPGERQADTGLRDPGPSARMPSGLG